MFSFHADKVTKVVQQKSITGWWFGTCFIFPYIGNVIIPTDFHIFQRGRSTTNQIMSPKNFLWCCQVPCCFFDLDLLHDVRLEVDGAAAGGSNGWNGFYLMGILWDERMGIIGS